MDAMAVASASGREGNEYGGAGVLFAPNSTRSVREWVLSAECSMLCLILTLNPHCSCYLAPGSAQAASGVGRQTGLVLEHNTPPRGESFAFTLDEDVG